MTPAPALPKPGLPIIWRSFLLPQFGQQLAEKKECVTKILT
jgi:hypothetical protein